MKIAKSIVRAIIAHAKKDAPTEVCGYLAAKDGLTIKHYELTNTDKSNEHFSFDPKEQFAALRSSRADDLEISAVYHSHPETPAWPSAEDTKLAYDPNISYVIVSLVDKGEAVKAFKILGREVKEEELEVIEDV